MEAESKHNRVFFTLSVFCTEAKMRGELISGGQNQEWLASGPPLKIFEAQMSPIRANGTLLSHVTIGTLTQTRQKP